MGWLQDRRTKRILWDKWKILTGGKRDVSLADIDEMMDQQLKGFATYAKKDVTGDTALNYSAVWCAVGIISSTIASLPLLLYERVGERAKRRFPKSPLYAVLHDRPNPEMTSFTWREISAQHVLLWGNAYSQIMWDGAGRPTALWPMNPERVSSERWEDGTLVYVFKDKRNENRYLRASDVLHIPGLGFDGRVGYSVISKAREAIGLGLATEELGSRFFGQGTHLGGVLTHPNRLSPTAAENLKKSWKAVYGGLQGSHEVGVLEEGMVYTPMTMKAEDAQFLQTRVFQIDEIARWFNIPPHKLKELSKATYSNIEEQQLEFLTDTLRPWLVRMEQVYNWKLLDEQDQKRLFVEHLVDAILRGNIATRYAAYHTARMDGVLNADEWRALENMNPIGGKVGKSYLWPLNMMPADSQMMVQPQSVMQSKEEVPGKPEEVPGKPEGEESEEEEEKSLVRRLEARKIDARSVRSIVWRRRMANMYRPRFADATKRILKVERENVMRIARTELSGQLRAGKRDVASFGYGLDDWYMSVETQEFVKKEFAGVYTTYAADIHNIVVNEVGNPNIPMDEYFQEEVDRFAENTSQRYLRSSRGQLKSVARKAVAQRATDDPIVAIETRLDEWDEKRPDRVADREVVDGESGVATFVYFQGGFRSQWVAIGKSCPYCNSLDGKIIGRGGSYLAAGESLQPAGAAYPLTMTHNITHPAAHASCDCTCVAVL
jgi:HK97 family phage portal protein